MRYPHSDLRTATPYFSCKSGIFGNAAEAVYGNRALFPIPPWMPPRKPKKITWPLNAEERRQLLAAPSRRYKTSRRNRAMMATMMYAGLRCQELCNLKYGDIDLSTYIIKVKQGKGRKDRPVPIEPLLEAYLREWKAERWPGEAFFSTRNGKRVATSEVRRMVTRYAARAGLDGVHPHLLRKTCATYWANERKLSSRRVQANLGHSRLATTELYLAADPEEIRAEMRSWT